MHRISLIGIVLFSLFFSISSAIAETYTLEECIETGLQNNYGVIEARNIYDASRWSEKSAWGNILPSVSLSGSRNESKSNKIDPYTGSFSTYQLYYSANATLSQTFAGLGIGTYASIKQQQAQRYSSYYGYVDTRDQLVLSIKEAYFNVIKTKMLADVAKDAVQRGEEQLKVAQSKYDLGSASLSDVLKAKVLYGNSKLDLITAENNYDISRANLNYSMGIDITTEIEVEEEFPEIEQKLDYDQALSEALSHNPTYRKAQFDFSKAKASRWLSRTNFLPSLQFSFNQYTTANTANDLITVNDNNSGYGFRISLFFNVFNGLTDYAELYASSKDVNTQKENVENTKNSVSLEVKQAYLDVNQNQEKLNLNNESVAAAQEDLNIVREKYNLGAATILEVLDAEVSFKEAQTNQVQAQFDYHLAVSRLEKAMGR